MLAIVAFGFATGCSDDDRVTGGTVNGNGVYFPTTFNPTISLAENQSSVVVPVHRTVDATDFSMPILLVEEAGKEGFFTCDSKALFKAGSKESSVTLRFDPDAVEVGESYYCNLLLSDDTNAANYGLTSLEISIMFDPWKRLGIAYWRDDIFGNLFGLDELYPETECVAYEHMNIKGYYKIQEVYTPAFAGGMFGATADDFVAEEINEKASVRNKFLTPTLPREFISAVEKINITHSFIPYKRNIPRYIDNRFKGYVPFKKAVPYHRLI
jgi:hypothetical protein